MESNRKPRRAVAQARRAGLSLFEVLITVAVIGILAGILLPNLQASIPDRLEAVGQIIAADLEYGRSLAVANNSKYRFRFELAQNRYYLQHSGASALLAALPQNPFRPNYEQIDRQYTELNDLPIGKPAVTLVSVVRSSGTPVSVNDVEFLPSGGTASSQPTIVWLGCGRGAGRRYLSITINPTTGLVEPGEVRKELPAGINDASAAKLPPSDKLFALLRTASQERHEGVAG